MHNIYSAKKALRKLSNPEKAKLLQSYFKTGKGEYGEGDIFLGLTVPQLHKLSKEFQELALEDIKKLLQSKIHEERSLALMILVLQFSRALKITDEKGQARIYNFYLKHKKHINNWDLIDGSARDIVGAYLFFRDRKALYKLAKSKSLWDRRIAIISTFYFIREKDFTDTLKICELLLKDPEDLIHKASGWMLREMGKKDLKPLLQFLNKYSEKMPRTMLRYAIEKLPEQQRLSLLNRRRQKIIVN